jgi:hypothetical protein
MAGFNVKDVVGLGEVVGHVKDLLLKIIEIVSAREERRLRNEALRLDNTRKFLDTAKEHHLSPERLKYYEELANGSARAACAEENTPGDVILRARLGKGQSASDT